MKYAWIVDFVAGLRMHALEQGDLSLQSGQQRGGRRLVEPPLQRGAQSIGVAVADIEALRCHFSCHRYARFANSCLALSSSASTSSSSI